MKGRDVMGDYSERGQGPSRRQVLRGGVVAGALGAVAALFPELGASAEARQARAESADQEWYIRSAATSVELSPERAAAAARPHLAAFRTAAHPSAVSAPGADAAAAPVAANRTMADGSSILVTGSVVAANRGLLVWEETLASGTRGRTHAEVWEYDEEGNVLNLVASGGNANVVASPAFASAAACPVGTHALRECVSLDFGGFSGCCVPCLPSVVNPIAFAICAIAVCGTCYVNNCKKWGNVCVVNS
jgi:hypothetical protein